MSYADLRHGLILAPMAGVTDYAFRTICRAQGAEYTVSEMISAKAAGLLSSAAGGHGRQVQRRWLRSGPAK